MNWSQKLFLVRLGCGTVFLVSAVGLFIGGAAESALLGTVSLLLLVTSLVVAWGAKLVTKLVFRWHEAGSVGPGTRIWYN